jgi:hypothetical protein
MKPRPLLSLLLALAMVVALAFPASAQPASRAEETLPLIILEEVPLPDAIRNLARQSSLNLILDQKLASFSVGADGKPCRPPNITKRFEKVSARQAMGQIAAEHKLVLVESEATTVTCVTFADRGAKPVPASQVFGDTNKIAPLILLDDVPLSDALKLLAREAGLTIELDPKVSGNTPDSRGRIGMPPMVSLRWEKLSHAQALAAVVDAYDLEMVKVEAGDKYRISPKARTAATEKPPPSAKEK